MARSENWSPTRSSNCAPQSRDGETEDVAFAEITDRALAVIIFAAEPGEPAPDQNQSVRVIALPRDDRLLRETLLRGSFAHRPVGSVPLEIAVALKLGVIGDLVHRFVGKILQQRSLAQMRGQAAFR